MFVVKIKSYVNEFAITYKFSDRKEACAFLEMQIDALEYATGSVQIIVEKEKAP